MKRAPLSAVGQRSPRKKDSLVYTGRPELCERTDLPEIRGGRTEGVSESAMTYSRFSSRNRKAATVAGSGLVTRKEVCRSDHSIGVSIGRLEGPEVNSYWLAHRMRAIQSISFMS